jgi:predicted PurR-regulated permease PerM
MENTNQLPVQPQVQAQPLVQPQTQAQPLPLQPVPQNKGINKLLVVFAVLIFIAILSGGLFAYNSYKTSKTNLQQTANVYNPSKNINNPAKQAVVNNTINDTSDTQIDKDLQSVDQSLNNVDANSTAVDQGLSDQQTNLQ